MADRRRNCGGIADRVRYRDRNVESAVNALCRERSISRGVGERNGERFAFPERTIRTDQTHWVPHRIECRLSRGEWSQSDAFARRAWRHREIQSAGHGLAAMATR